MVIVSSLSAWALAHKDQIAALKALGELIAVAAVVLAIVVYVIRDPAGAPEKLLKRA